MEHEVLVDEAVGADAPALSVKGEQITIYFTRGKGASSMVARLRMASLEDPTPLAPGIEVGGADGGGWATPGTSEPALLLPLSAPAGDGYLLCYRKEAGIECATSTDGDQYRVEPALALLPLGAEEGTTLGSPALVHIPASGGSGDHRGRARLYYLASSDEKSTSARLYAADAPLPLGSGPFVRVDGNPATPGRDPVLAPGAVSWLPALGHVSARTLITAAGRPRYDLFLSGNVGLLRAVGAASSYDATIFTVAAQPFADPHPPDKWAPSVAAYRDGTLLVYATPSVGHSVLAAATGP
jgi:hypothetical protein